MIRDRLRITKASSYGGFLHFAISGAGIIGPQTEFIRENSFFLLWRHTRLKNICKFECHSETTLLIVCLFMFLCR